MDTVSTSYFAGGCFWCITPDFQETPGVLGVTSGYSGGEEADPTYLDVKYQRTGHRETVRVAYDADRVSFEELADIFLKGVDPFDAGGQYIDRGHSYTLAVYYLCDAQRQIMERKLRLLEETSGRPVFVSLEPFRNFYPAEEEHQDYYRKHPEEFRKELIESGRLMP